MLSVPALPPGTHLIHIGPPKTGSTTLQYNLLARREELHERGIDYPTGKGSRARMAGWWITGFGAPMGRRSPRQSDWDDYVAEVAECDRERMIISTEVFAQASAEAAHKIVTDLGGEKPHMVYVVRGMDRFFPSYYQERLKAGLALPYHEWLGAMLDENDPRRKMRNFIMGAQMVGEVVDKWAPAVGYENITLIIADDKNRDQLPATFAQLLDLPDDFLFGSDSNQSLSWSSAEVLRTFNQNWTTDPDRDRRAYHKLIQRGLIQGVRDVPSQVPTVKFPAAPSWAQDKLKALVENQHAEVLRLQEAGVRVVGNPEALLAMREPADVEAPQVVPVAEAAAMVESLFDHAARRERNQAERYESRIAALEDKLHEQRGQSVANTSTKSLLTLAAGRIKRRLTKG